MSQEIANPQQGSENKLSTQLANRKIEPHQWNTLKRSFFPDASNDSVLMYIDYCLARELDVMKRPAHIVPMKYKDKDGSWKWRDVILPGIYDYRMTAHDTGDYLGHSEPEYGEIKEQFGVEAPEWCSMTMYRWNPKANCRVEFPVKVFFSECAATYYDKDAGKVRANARWTKAPIQMMTKCTEAAGLREAFPGDIGGEPTYEEMDGQVHDVTPRAETPKQRPALEDRMADSGAGFTQQTVSVSDNAGVEDKMGAEVRKAPDKAQEAPKQASSQAESKAGKAPPANKPAPQKTPQTAPSEGEGEGVCTLDHVLELMETAENAEELVYARDKAQHLDEEGQAEANDYFRTRIKELNQKKNAEPEQADVEFD